MNTLTTNLIQEQTELQEKIFEHKSAINNITLQLDREDPDDDSKKKWRAGAVYSRSMKEAELELFENQLDALKSAIKESSRVSSGDDSNSGMIAKEFMNAAARRLEPEVFSSLKAEAEEVVQDVIYDSAHCTHGNVQH